MNESEFENELKSLPPAPASARLAERVAAEMAAASAVVVAAPRAVVASKPAGGIIAKPAVAETGAGWLGWLRGFGWAAAGAAAAVAVLSLREPQRVEHPSLSKDGSDSPQTSMAAMNDEPAAASEELIETTDDGLIYEDGAPQRQMRMTYIEHRTWTNPRTGAVIEMEVPREDIVLMPVAMQ